MKASAKLHYPLGIIFNFFKKHYFYILAIFVVAFLLTLVHSVSSQLQINHLTLSQAQVQKQLEETNKELIDLKNQDQYKINQDLEAKIKNIEVTYTDAVGLYEKLLDLKTQVKNTTGYDTLFAESLKYLADKNYASASASLQQLATSIQTEQDKLAAAAVTGLTSAQIANTPKSNSPPSNGFSQQQVTIDDGTYLVDIIAADLNSTRVIVDTASSSDCGNNCPVLPLSDYVSRTGAYAGINGTFFCPVDYPSCAGKTGSFDTLLMNKDKYYFNSSNNIYSNVPLVYFTGNTMGVRGASSQWGRDTGVDSVIAMQPLLVSGGNIAYTDSTDPKFNSKGPRSFIASRGSAVFIGFTFNATMGESAKVMKALGMETALNLDEGGSSALWYEGYKVGPGRNIPNAVLFVRK